MKKLLVLALAAIMVLSVAAVSMAAVTVGGEVNFGWNLIDSSTNTGKQTQNDFADAKVTATAELNDEVSAFAAIKSDNFAGSKTFIDEAWVKFTEGFGTIKVGYFGWNIKENLDIINLVPDLKTDAGFNAVIKASDSVTIDLAAGQPYDKAADTGADGGFVYGAKVKYDTDVFGVSLAMANFGNYEKGADAPMSLNGYYKMDAFCFFLNYIPEFKLSDATGNAKVKSAIIGATYDSADVPVYARLEYDVQATDNTETPYGFRIGYKLNGAKIEYQTKIDTLQPKDTKAVSYLKLNVAF